ncbi:MAG: MlaD family protein [Desulfobacterales bacterium]|jgi:phospholipid/cholesterol/gamma-HCH transport system substrate-binding protein
MKETLRQPKFRYTNETVGLFVLISLLIFVAGLIYSGQVRKWFNPGETLKVVLPDEGLSGLSVGSKVEILGTQAGEVRDIVINPDQKIHANVRIDSKMAVFVRSDSKAFIRKTFGIAGDAYLEITRGTEAPLDWEFAVLTVESDRKTSDTLAELIEELRAKILPVVEDVHQAILLLTNVAKDLQDPEKGVQQLLTNLNSIADKIARGEGALGRLLTEDTLVRDLESLIARLAPLFDDLEEMVDNVSEYSAEFDTETGDIPKITRSLKKTMASLEIVMKDLSEATPRLPKIVENVGDTADEVPTLVLQLQQVMVELERLIQQLQSNWLLGGGSSQPSQTATRISPLEVNP